MNLFATYIEARMEKAMKDLDQQTQSLIYAVTGKFDNWPEVEAPKPQFSESQRIIQQTQERLKRLQTRVTRLEHKLERTKAAKAEMERFLKHIQEMLKVIGEQK